MTRARQGRSPKPGPPPPGRKGADRSSPYAAYVFDFDGALMDSESLSPQTQQAALAECGVAVPLARVRAEPFTTVARLRDRFGVPACAAVGFLLASQHTEGTWRRGCTLSESSVISHILDAFGVVEHPVSQAIPAITR